MEILFFLLSVFHDKQVRQQHEQKIQLYYLMILLLILVKTKFFELVYFYELLRVSSFILEQRKIFIFICIFR